MLYYYWCVWFQYK